MSVETDIAELKRDMKYVIDMIASKCVKMDKHIEESHVVRMEIHDNTRFRSGVTKAIWVIYTALTGLLIKVFFFK